ncbi:MAG: aminotransferase class I/II-fold pyridoxal phosphate-dependent enzyme [Phycisphaerales bacterium]|nr:aminotransferase class I/II-fold pyridoxal phosphate-dependent enzyme [Phycisphaerales bacterium]
MQRPVRSDRLGLLPPFLFDEIDRKRRERLAAGADVINLGVGDPDKPTPGFVIEAMDRAMRELSNQQYPAVGGGLKVFREAAARFIERRFGVKVDPMRHVLALLGSKDGISHLPWAVTNPGDMVCVPDPAYPVYEIGAVLAGCRVHKLPVDASTGWKPVLSDASVPAGARLLWTNYPSNPTAASADLRFHENVLEFCAGRGVIVASDLAYSEVYLDGRPSRPPSMWEARNADIEQTRAIEFHSLSKTFNMTGWRLGFAIGHAEVIGALQAIKSNVDSGTFNAIQVAGAAALDQFDHADVEAMRQRYRERRDAIIPSLRSIGCEVEPPSSGFFIWARTPLARSGSGMGKPLPSMQFAGRLLEEADTVVVPGAGFSPRGEGYIRIALTVEADRMRQVGERLVGLAP